MVARPVLLQGELAMAGDPWQPQEHDKGGGGERWAGLMLGISFNCTRRSEDAGYQRRQGLLYAFVGGVESNMERRVSGW